MNKLRNYFISGLVVFLPIVLTGYIFYHAIGFADGILGQYLKPYFDDNFGFYFSGISIFVLLCIIVSVGFFVTNFLGKSIYDFFEKMFVRLPVIRQIYLTLKEVAQFLFERDKISTFKQVVLVEYPRKGIYSFGFLTNEAPFEVRDKTKKDLCNIFIPSAPQPITGYVIMVPRKEIIFTNIGIEAAFKFVVSGGVVNPT